MSKFLSVDIFIYVCSDVLKMKRKFTFITILILTIFVIGVYTFSEKNLMNESVLGHSYSSQTWSGTITIKGDVSFAPGTTLTLLPGTMVLFEKDPNVPETDWTERADKFIKDHNDSTGREGYSTSHFSISAKIIAIGTKEQPIIFTSAQTNKEYADWDQIILFSESVLDNVEVSYAHNGVNIEEKNVIVRNSKIHDSLWSCIDIFSANNLVEENEIYHCWHQAIGVKIPGENLVQNNYIHDSQLSVNCEFEANPIVKNNRFTSATYGLNCLYDQSNEVEDRLADTDGGTYNGVLIYPSNRNS